MNFPANFAEAETLIKEHQNSAKQLHMQLEIFKRDAERQIGTDKEFVKILSGLMNSWKQRDPGKYGDAYFFIRGPRRDRVVVRELLPDLSVLARNKEEWKKSCAKRSYPGADYEKMPIWFPVVTLAEITKHFCPLCGAEQPLIEHYVQACDSPEGDTWLKEYLAFCAPCKTASRIERETSSFRF